MIRVIKQGDYQLIQADESTRILALSDKGNYIWINAHGNGEIVASSYKKQRSDQILAYGKYRVYKVKDEVNLACAIHLELSTGRGTWKGFILSEGLPKNKEMHNRIIPTDEVITQTAIGHFI